MKKLACAVLRVMIGSACLPATAQAQIARSQIYTTPLPPPREVLDRLNLQMAWWQYVPMDGRRDGLVTVQLRGRDMFVQTRSGLVALFDAETGAARWRTRVGLPYKVEHELAFNSREVYVINSTYLYALDRKTGGVRWQYRLREGVSAPPIADERFLYIGSASSRFTAYRLPRPDLEATPTGTIPPGPNVGSGPATMVETEEQRHQRMVSVRGDPRRSTGSVSPLTSAREAGSTEELIGPIPIREWELVTGQRLEFPVLYTSTYLLLPTPSGVVLALGKLPRENGMAAEIYRFSADAPITSPAGHYEDVAYIGAQNADLYALEVETGHIRWRYTAGTPLTRPPVATEEDVYLVAQRNGLTRLDRATGTPLWRIPFRGQLVESNAAADRFLAVNPKYVYASDPSGRLLILDRRRGVVLSGYDVHDFVFPIPNNVTDRLYLAANNGLIVCLHDRDYATPVRHRPREEAADSPVRIRLADPVTLAGIPRITLRQLLDKWMKDYPVLRFRIDEDAFQKAMLESPADKEVKLLPVDSKPLGEVLQNVLDPLKATYEVAVDPAAGEIVRIIPAQRRKE